MSDYGCDRAPKPKREAKIDIRANLYAGPLPSPVRPVSPVSAIQDIAGGGERFRDLATTVLGLDGQASDETRVKAYADLQSMANTGQLRGLADADRQLIQRATADSDIGQRSAQLQKSHIGAMNAGFAAGGPAAAIKAAISSFESLSGSDQAILFQAGLNAADRTGAKPYNDAQGYRENLGAQLKMVNFMKASGAVGPSGALDAKVASAKAADPKFAAALKLAYAPDNTSAAWTQRVQSLFGADMPKDRVELSPDARKLMGGSAPDAAPAGAPAYTQGSIVSRTA